MNYYHYNAVVLKLGGTPPLGGCMRFKSGCARNEWSGQSIAIGYRIFGFQNAAKSFPLMKVISKKLFFDFAIGWAASFFLASSKGGAFQTV